MQIIYCSTHGFSQDSSHNNSTIGFQGGWVWDKGETKYMLEFFSVQDNPFNNDLFFTETRTKDL